jgi:multicomponent K+:H+ antiporter subunit E
MRSLLPSPWLSAVLFVAWPLLNQSWSLAQVSLGAFLALLVPWLTRSLLTDPHGIVTLAGIITLTPGTLSSELTTDRRHLLIHAFNVPDAAALVAVIKTRYEAPLMAIFEGKST